LGKAGKGVNIKKEETVNGVKVRNGIKRR